MSNIPRDTVGADATKEVTAQALTPLIEEYLLETKSPATVPEFLNEFAIAPIYIEQKLNGFWGLFIKESKSGKVATIKAFYIRPELRGREMNAATDDLIRGLTSKGVKFMEVWAFPQVQQWLTKRYGIHPRVHVNFDPIETYQVYEDKK